LTAELLFDWAPKTQLRTPIDRLNGYDDEFKLMPKRKNQDTADVMSAPPKKTKATKKKVAEEGTYFCFKFYYARAHAQGHRPRGEVKDGD
jgi:hypothetical protein